MNSILGLQVVDQIEGPIDVDGHIRLGQCEPFTRSNEIGERTPDDHLSLIGVRAKKFIQGEEFGGGLLIAGTEQCRIARDLGQSACE